MKTLKVLQESEILLTNYLVAGKFPKGSDCEVVRDLIRCELERLKDKHFSTATYRTIDGRWWRFFDTIAIKLEDAESIEVIWGRAEGSYS